MTLIYAILTALLVASNVFWYRIKFTLRDRGYPTDYFSHLQDLRDFSELIAKEKDPVRKEKYVRMQGRLYVSLAALFLLFMTLPVWMIAT